MWEQESVKIRGCERMLEKGIEGGSERECGGARVSWSERVWERERQEKVCGSERECVGAIESV